MPWSMLHCKHLFCISTQKLLILSARQCCLLTHVATLIHVSLLYLVTQCVRPASQCSVSFEQSFLGSGGYWYFPPISAEQPLLAFFSFDSPLTNRWPAHDVARIITATTENIFRPFSWALAAGHDHHHHQSRKVVARFDLHC